VKTHGGSSYFLTIIDDFSRRIWLYVSKNKSEAFQKFREWHTLIGNQHGPKLKVSRTDNGPEFVSEQFNEFCKKIGIKRHKTVPYTPQQNGLAERMNMTILERVRCMLLSVGLRKTFWGEATNTAAYLINRCPSLALGFKIPMEAWSGEPPDYSGLKVFGSLTFAHVKQGKLDARAVKCVFNGYPKGVKGYKLWKLEPSETRCIISRDVTFDESRLEMRSKEQKDNNLSSESTNFEVEHYEILDHGSGDTIDHTDQGEAGDNKELATQHDLSNYQLTRDREKRVIKPTKRYDHADVICYALSVDEEIQNSESKTWREAIESEDNQLWLQAMSEEI